MPTAISGFNFVLYIITRGVSKATHYSLPLTTTRSEAQRGAEIPAFRIEPSRVTLCKLPQPHIDYTPAPNHATFAIQQHELAAEIANGKLSFSLQFVAVVTVCGCYCASPPPLSYPDAYCWQSAGKRSISVLGDTEKFLICLDMRGTGYSSREFQELPCSPLALLQSTLQTPRNTNVQRNINNTTMKETVSKQTVSNSKNSSNPSTMP